MIDAEPTPYAVVFSGGGALGSWEVGCYRAIVERQNGHLPEIVTGASAGALNAAAVCAGLSTDDLEKLWSNLKDDQVYEPQFGWGTYLRFAVSALRQRSIQKAAATKLRQDRSILKTAPLKKTLGNIFTGNRATGFQLSKICFAISLTNLTEKRREVFYRTPDDHPPIDRPNWVRIRSPEMLIQALMGTTALPVLFPQFESWFDGGVLMNQPISPAILLGGQLIYVLIPTPAALGETTDLLQIASTALSVWLAESLIMQVELIKVRNDIRRSTGDPLLKICIIRPLRNLEEAFGVSLLSFGVKIPELIKQGYDDAKTRLETFDQENPTTWDS